MKLSAIICAYNEERMLGPAIHSLFAQTRVPDEIIVVNNASTDDTRAVAASECRRHVSSKSRTRAW